jgi:hypothetical protein
MIFKYEYENHTQKYESHTQKYESHTQKYESHTQKYESHTQKYESHTQKYESHTQKYESHRQSLINKLHHVIFHKSFVFTKFQLYRGGGNRSTWRKPVTCRKSLTNFITL